MLGEKVPTIVVFFSSHNFREIRTQPNTNKFQGFQPVKNDNAEQVPHDELERGSGGGAEVEALQSINQSINHLFQDYFIAYYCQITFGKLTK